MLFEKTRLGKKEDKRLEGSLRSQGSFTPVSKLVCPRGFYDIHYATLGILPIGLECVCSTLHLQRAKLKFT